MKQFKAKTIAVCPFCNSMYKVAIDLTGKNLRCSKCKQKFSLKKDMETSGENNIDAELLFCKIALHYGYISESQLETVLIEHTKMAQKGIHKNFKEIFLKKGFLNSETALSISNILPKGELRQLEKKYAAIAVAKSLIQQETPAIKAEARTEAKNKRQETIFESDKIKPDKPLIPETDKFTSESKQRPALETKKPVNIVSGNLSPILPKPTVTPPEKPQAKLKIEPSRPAITETQNLSLVSDAALEEKEAIENYTYEPDENDQEQIVNKINGLELIITGDRVIAFLRAPDDIQADTSVESIRQILADENIDFGIVDDSLIKGFLNSKVFREKPFKIAEGTHAKKGVEGIVKYHFDTEHLKVGAVSESGEIDFKNRGEIPYVKQGDLLAEISPAVIGENGVDIYGHIIAVPLICPIALRCETGAELSEDGLKVFAKNDGQPKLTIDERLYVLAELTIPGDVGFETGHIEFDGNINIAGTIQSDFMVKGGNITAKEVLEAKIFATGDLIVSDGIKGATIKTEGNITAKFIHKGNIKAFGNVIVEKEIIDSKIKNSGGCQVKRGKIIASEISSKQGIEAVEVGTEMSEPSKLKIGVDDHINSEIGIIDNKITQKNASALELKNEIDFLNEEDKKLHLLIAEFAHLQERSQLEVNSLKKNMTQLNLPEKDGKNNEIAAIEKQIEALSKKIIEADKDVNKQFDAQDIITDRIAECKKLLRSCEDELDILQHEKKSLIDWINEQKTIAYIKTSGAIYHGTTITGSNSSKVIKETIRHTNIREVKNPETAEGWEIKIA